ALTVSVLYWGTMTEPLYLFLIYTGLAALLAGLDDNRPWLLAAAGAFFGFAYLTRPEAILYFCIFLTFGVAWFIVHHGHTDLRCGYRSLFVGLGGIVKRVSVTIGGFALMFAFLATPYVLYLHRQTGFWMISGKLNVIGIEGSADKLDSTGREIMWLSPDRF